MNLSKILFLSSAFLFCAVNLSAQKSDDYKLYKKELRQTLYKDYKLMCREPGGELQYPFLVPGSAQYADMLWDWDSWLSNIALRQIIADTGSAQDAKDVQEYERGCILNFLNHCQGDGWVPVLINKNGDVNASRPKNVYEVNMHKPCLAQHAAFLVKMDGGRGDWLKDKFFRLQYFVGAYNNRYKDPATGLFFWQNDHYIGVDNDPCTYYRPDRSSASIYLNCLMYKELMAMVYLSQCFDMKEIGEQYAKDAKNLKDAIQEHCWDERDGFFYSVDLNLKPVNRDSWALHSGAPRTYDCLIQRIGVWTGFMAMWADIATPEQAKRMVEEHYLNEKTFNAPYGVRSLSKMEKMYNLKASTNPSSWQGPIWGISNYMTWRGLVKYGFDKEATELANKTTALFGRDLRNTGTLHEYYQPENGEPILNPGFQNWNYLVVNMLAWLEGNKVIEEF